MAQSKAKKRCPPHSIWHAIAARAKPGELLCPGFYATQVNNATKAVFEKLKTPRSQSYSRRGFRLGAAQGLKGKGPQWSVVAGVGEWRSLAFRDYVDTALDVERDMPKLPIETGQLSEEEGEYDQ